jgi:hypothetical protein
MEQMIKYKENENINHKILGTTKGVAEKLITIMKNSISRSNKMNKDEVFRRLFNKNNDGTISDFVRWEFTKRAMSYLRKHSYCYIVFERIGQEYFYYVVKNYGDEKGYVDMLDKTMKKMNMAKKRVQKAIDEKWYKRHWSIEYDRKKQLN